MMVLRMVMSRGRQMKKKNKKKKKIMTIMMMMMMVMIMMMMRRRRRRHVTGAILCENLQVKCRRPDGSHDRDPDFAQICTVEMYLDMSQEQFVGAVAVEMHLDMSEDVRKAIACENLLEKYRRPRPRPRLCASLRSRNALGHVTRTILYKK